MNFISILIGKLCVFILEKIGRGSSMPGDIAYKLNKNILKCFKLPDKVIAVTGSSGKGSTSKIINDVFKKFGISVCYNDKGSNERSAIISTLLKYSNLKGKIKTDACVFEMDERYAKYVFPYIKPNYVVITNITRDQVPRQGHFDIVYNEILSSLTKETNLVINGDDPYLQKFNLENKYNIIYFGTNKLKYSYKKNKFNNLNITRCLNCNSKLEYNYYNIEYLGNYYCPNCNFKRPNINYEITNFNYKDNILTINNKNNIYVNNDMLFNLYNISAAFSILSEYNLDKDKISTYISEMEKDKKIYNKYKYNDKNVYVLNNKNENSTTFNQSILYTSNDKELKTVVIGWYQISRRYDFDDLSWIYDIDFNLINNVDKFIVCGPQRYDIAVALKYNGFDENKIIIKEDIYKAKNDIKTSKGNIYAILNFDYIKPFNKVMEEL